MTAAQHQHKLNGFKNDLINEINQLVQEQPLLYAATPELPYLIDGSVVTNERTPDEQGWVTMNGLHCNNSNQVRILTLGGRDHTKADYSLLTYDGDEGLDEDEDEDIYDEKALSAFDVLELLDLYEHLERVFRHNP